MRAVNSLLILCSFVLFGCKKDKAPEVINCDQDISFANQIQPMMDTYCVSCHQSQAPILTNHSDVSANATAILNSIKGNTQLMPLNGPKLNDSLIEQFNCWIQQGKLNN